ncbi:hypothetical protein M0R45_031092 [Rubus argutus]|uniref:Uncharacterized protein n=1 Tax=Rubus argutus TaxID=59490 RepID=A0AAW1WH25_RUBAR
MHQAIQYKSWAALHSSATLPLRCTTPAEVISEANSNINTTERTTRNFNVNIDPVKISNLVSENAVNR